MCLAVPGRIESLHGAGLARCAQVSFAGVRREVSLAYLPDAEIGDYVVVHAGCALARLDEAEAARVFETLAELEALQDAAAAPGAAP